MLETNGDDLILGTDGDDSLVGDIGVDTLVGGLGDDVLHVNDLSGTSSAWITDVMIGGGGKDTFVLGGTYPTIGSYATIADWEYGDSIVLPEGEYSLQVQGNSTWILDCNGNDVALVAGYTGNDISWTSG